MVRVLPYTMQFNTERVASIDRKISTNINNEVEYVSNSPSSRSLLYLFGSSFVYERSSPTYLVLRTVHRFYPDPEKEFEYYFGEIQKVCRQDGNEQFQIQRFVHQLRSPDILPVGQKRGWRLALWRVSINLKSLNFILQEIYESWECRKNSQWV